MTRAFGDDAQPAGTGNGTKGGSGGGELGGGGGGNDGSGGSGCSKVPPPQAQHASRGSRSIHR